MYKIYQKGVKMNKKTYMQTILEAIEDTEIGYPIFVNELGRRIVKEFDLPDHKANAAAAVAVKRIMDNNMVTSLRFFSKGIYYLTKPTVFGETAINKDKLIELKYLSKDNGYETGHAIMQKLGFTTQMPAERMIVSNMAMKRAKRNDDLNIIVKAPKVKVTKDNKSYLQFLDILTIYDKVPIDTDEPSKLLNNIIAVKHLDFKKLLAIADRYYNKDTVLRLAHVASQGEERL